MQSGAVLIIVEPRANR